MARKKPEEPEEPDLLSLTEIVDNTLVVLRSRGADTPGKASATVRLAIQTLDECRKSLGGLAEQLEVLTEPGGDLAGKLVDLRKELERAKSRIQDLEVDVATARSDAEIERQVGAEDRKERAALEKRVKALGGAILKDGGKFDDFMTDALKKNPPERR